MTGNEIVLSLACALAEERARHEQTRQALIRDLSAAHEAHDATRAAAKADREKLERERRDLLDALRDAAADDGRTPIGELLMNVRAVLARHDPDA